MTSTFDTAVNGFSGSGNNIENFEAKVGSWTIDSAGNVKAGKNFRSQLIHKTLRLSGPFSISAELKLSDLETQSWDGVVVNFRPNRARNGNEFLTLRVRRGGSNPPSWQLLVVDTATKDDSADNVIGSGPLSDLQASKAVKVTLSADLNRVLQYSVEQEGKVIGSGPIPSAKPIEWANDARVGVYSYMGGNTSFSSFQATSTSGVFDAFQRTGVPGTLEAQQLAGRWQEDLDDWIVGNGSARAVLAGAVKEAILLHAQPLVVDSTLEASSVLSADVKMDDTGSWTGLVFGAKNNTARAGDSRYNIHPDNYFAFQIKSGAWQVIHRVQAGASTVLAQADSGLTITAGATYRLRVQFDSATQVRVSVTQNGNVVLKEQLVALDPTPSGARFGLFSSSARNVFTQAAAAPVMLRPDTPPAIEQSGTPPKWSSYWTPNATYWSSPYKVSAPTLLDNKPVDGASNNCIGDPQQCLYTVVDESGSPVRQYVGYYAAGGAVAITKRSWSKSDNTWSPFEPSVVLATKLPEGDGHYRITIGESADGHVHVVANVWASKLVYYKTGIAQNLSTLTLQNFMVSSDVETRTTYPEFMRVQIDAKDRLLFLYRTGGSGDGDWIFNQYVDGKWSRYLAGFLFAGSSKSGTTHSAYPATRAPVLGPDGNFHVAWIWRSTEFPGSNSRICYAYSANLRTWRSASGEIIANGEISDSITYDDEAAIVDDVPENGGALNGLVSLGFDHDGQPMIGYVKFDDPSSGSSQFYVARWRTTCGSWQRTQLTNYLGRWTPLAAGGTVPTPFNIAGATAQKTASGEKVIALPYIYGDHAGTFVLSSETLEVIGETDWRTYSNLIPTPTGMRTALITRDSCTTTFGTNHDEEYVLLNFAVGKGELLPAGADTSMKVLRVK
ncbi:hypothetical protein AWB75_02236 [Caballeronia catudaia]|uniref:SO2946-like C-terminal domain-containing protein n=1 Tax=Caballeronia catudaia TaxID=1777136 RepID=A0A158AIV1_9BURK|nr:BNR repeat-containing protein [Caballeronia catudaia]SAK57546.1 hypothetical protein AWB75_02236 [Caballeronia catudaia]